MAAPYKFSLRPIGSYSSDDELKFQYNPEEYTISNNANWVGTGVALADFQNDYGNTVPFRWNGNDPSDLTFSIVLDARNRPINIPAEQLTRRIDEVRNPTIAAELTKLKKMTKKSTTGEPPELRLNMNGVAYDVIMKRHEIKVTASTGFGIPQAAEIQFSFSVLAQRNNG